MLSKNKIKFVKSLQQKKFRNEHGMFIVEGRKNLEALVQSDFEIVDFFLTQKVFDSSVLLRTPLSIIVSEKDLGRLTALKSNSEGLAVVKQKANTKLDFSGWSIYLDGVTDPGNLGTILRTADWFGIKQVVCSPTTVDFYNPKVVQSTMGSFTKIVPLYIDVKDYIDQIPGNYPVFVTIVEGGSPNQFQDVSKGLLVMGSESHGVSEAWLAGNYDTVTINKNPASAAESLNVAIATSVLCYEISKGII